MISAYRVVKSNTLAIAIEDDIGWRKVERFIESWMKQGHKDIIVKLTMM